MVGWSLAVRIVTVFTCFSRASIFSRVRWMGSLYIVPASAASSNFRSYSRFASSCHARACGNDHSLLQFVWHPVQSIGSSLVQDRLRCGSSQSLPDFVPFALPRPPTEAAAIVARGWHDVSNQLRNMSLFRHYLPSATGGSARCATATYKRMCCARCQFLYEATEIHRATAWPKLNITPEGLATLRRPRTLNYSALCTQKKRTACRIENSTHQKKTWFCSIHRSCSPDSYLQKFTP